MSRAPTKLYGKMGAGIEASGGSAGNTVAGVASLGGRAAFIGKVAADTLGDVFAHDTRQNGVHYETGRLAGGAATGRCLINVTPDGERTMCTFLGASVELTAADVDAGPDHGRRDRLPGGLSCSTRRRRGARSPRPQGLAEPPGRTIALTLSDAFVVGDATGPACASSSRPRSTCCSPTKPRSPRCSRSCSTSTRPPRAIQGLTKIAALTRSEKGSVVVTPTIRRTVAAFPVAKLVDTTGAGRPVRRRFHAGAGPRQAARPLRPPRRPRRRRSHLPLWPKAAGLARRARRRQRPFLISRGPPL